MSKNPIVGTCNLCLTESVKLSKEHIPPKSANNKDKVKIIRQNNSTNFMPAQDKGFLQGGFKLQTLCEDCNNKTGSYYGSAYKDFALNVSQIKSFSKAQQSIQFTAKGIHPLNVIKQVITTFCAISPILSTHDKNIITFLKERTARYDNFPFKIYAYISFVDFGRFTPLTVLADSITDNGKNILNNVQYNALTNYSRQEVMSNLGIGYSHSPLENQIQFLNHIRKYTEFTQKNSKILSEWAWCPCGWILSYEDYSDLNAVDVTNWLKYNYDQEETLPLDWPYNWVCTGTPLDYRSIDEVKEQGYRI
jgi:hypothetical protein